MPGRKRRQTPIDEQATLMVPSFPVLHIARVTVEAKTPVSIGTGAYDRRFDTVLVRDANGLPALPGASIGGTLRSDLEKAKGKPWVDTIFGRHATAGRELGPDAGAGSYEASRLTVSWGAAHDARDRPMRGLQLAGLNLSDPIVCLLAEEQPVGRDNVRISARTGAVDERGKFSRSLVPKGTRFTFELALASSSKDDQDWPTILAHVHRGFRIGGATRRGLGRLVCRKISTRTFDFSERGDLHEFAAYQTTPDCFALPCWTPSPDAVRAVADHDEARFLQLEIRLQAVDFLRIGQGDRAVVASARPNMSSPVVEPVIVWNNNTASIEEHVLFCPGSALKGVLSHRMAFHARCGAGTFVDDGIAAWMKTPDRQQRVAANTVDRSPVVELLGDVPEVATSGTSSNQPQRSARAGHVYFDDVYLAPARSRIGVMQHNSIDRFSAATRSGILFAEEMLYRPDIALEVRIDRQGASTRAARQAFASALHDLVGGKLALGAAAARGHGYFKGNIAPRDQLQSWIEAGA